MLNALDQIAETHGATPADVAVAWVIAQPSISAAIASGTNLEQLDSLINAARLRPSADDLVLLERASA